MSMTLGTPAFGVQVADLKADIMKYLSRRLDQFKDSTGITPNRIDVAILETTSHGDHIKNYTVGDVRVWFGDY